MRNTIYSLFVAGILLIPNGFGVFVASAYNNSNAVITNNISVTADSGNNSGATGQDGSDGQQGADGVQGDDGAGNFTTGDAQASVKVKNTVDGKEVPSAEIDIEVSGDSSVTIEKQQVITTDNGAVEINTEVSVGASGEAEVANEDEAPSQAPEASKSGFVSIVSGAFLSMIQSVASFISGLFELL